MKVRHVVITVSAVLAGCSLLRQPETPARPSIAPPSAPVAAPADDKTSRSEFRYRVLSPEATGIDEVFDDGHNTFITFTAAAPAGLLLFDDDGQALRFARFSRFSRYAVVTGLHPGVLVRTSTSYSYAAPVNPARVQAAHAGQASTVALPPELAAQRAIILQTQAQLAAIERTLEGRKKVSGPALEAINRELDEIQTVVNGLNARLVRLYFGSGRSNLTMSAAARAALKRTALQAQSITVRARTDSIGTPEVNQRVAWARGNAAQQLLKSMGVPAGAIKIDRAAQADYIADNTTAQARARNRRVELVVVAGAAEAKLPIDADGAGDQ